MNRIDKRVKDVLEKGEKYFMCYLPMGDPDLKTTRELVNLYMKAGVDLVELGLPSNDPYCDSRQIAESNQRSFKAEPDLKKYFGLIRAIRKDHPDEPFEVMAYSDFVKQYGVKNFVEELKSADIDAHLLANATVIQPDVVSEMDPLLLPTGIYRIRFMPHPFDDTLLPDIGSNAAGVMIMQSFADQSGNRPNVAEENRKLMKSIRDTKTKAAITFAYGIRNPTSAREAVEIGPDGILVGTAMVERIKAGDFKALEELIRGIKQATIS
ncbi:MAG TPA: tryptophan synthase subunit alpha [Anaerolineae bacterium]|nr:tryptophan synthase subunit alpha [Anaerolineae bacterium]